MPVEALLPTLKILLKKDDDGEDALLLALLRQARDTVLALTGRQTLPPALVCAVTDLAVLRFNRLGTEGESSRSEGSLRLGFDALPAPIEKQIRRYRLASVGGTNVPPEDRAQEAVYG